MLFHPSVSFRSWLMEKAQTAPSLQQCFALQLFCLLLFCIYVCLCIYICMYTHIKKTMWVDIITFCFPQTCIGEDMKAELTCQNKQGHAIKILNDMIFKMIFNCAKVTAGSTAQTTRLEEANKGCLKAQKVRRLWPIGRQVFTQQFKKLNFLVLTLMLIHWGMHYITAVRKWSVLWKINPCVVHSKAKVVDECK